MISRNFANIRVNDIYLQYNMTLVLGYNVDYINSVQFSNHTGYPFIKGDALDGKQLDELTEGLKVCM